MEIFRENIGHTWRGGHILFQIVQLTLKNQWSIHIVKNGNKITNLKAAGPVAKDSLFLTFG